MSKMHFNISHTNYMIYILETINAPTFQAIDWANNMMQYLNILEARTIFYRLRFKMPECL